MVRIGHLCDFHWGSADWTDAELETDLQYMVSKGLDEIVWGGDQIIGDEANVPHSPASDIRGFWDDVEAYMGSDVFDKSYALAGNHDIPYTHHIDVSSEYIDRDRLVTPIKIQPVDGVSIFLINTQGPAIVQGGGDSVGQHYCRVPYHELQWLDDELSKAANDGDIRIVIGHAPIWFGPDPNLVSYNPDVGWASKKYSYLGGEANTGQIYEIPQNYEMIRQVLEQHTPVIYLCGHDYHGPGAGGSAETSSLINGIQHVWQDHYSVGPSTLAYFDADPITGNVTYTTVNSSGHPSKTGLSEQDIINTTKSW